MALWQYGNNFLKKILGIAKNDEIKVVNDQFGSPSYTRELSKLLLNIILDYKEGNNIFGIIHYHLEISYHGMNLQKKFLI